jgi:hypothetical protein
MINPFKTLFVQPSYGERMALVTWSLPPGYEDGKVYVYRSPTGVEKSSDWILLNPDNPVTGITFFEDTDFVNFSFFYRLLLEHGDQEYDSAIIGTFSEQLTRNQYGLLYQLRHSEYLRMRYNGVPVLHCIPPTEGDLSSAFDPYTGSLAGTYCVDPDAFGTWFANGFKTIVQTRCEIVGIAPINRIESENGASKKDSTQMQFRLLGFPKPGIGHMLVLPYTDRRFVISGNIQSYELRGFLPVAYDVVVDELPFNDPRMKLQLPPLQEDGPYARLDYRL